jgi:serine/threonine protein phosphatase PrpC
MPSVLWGRDHGSYGKIAVTRPGPGVALALTRGLHPKPYRWVDPNEDVVAAVNGPRATLLVIADAHNGATASEVAVNTVLDHIGDDPPEDLDDADLVSLFARAGSDILAETRARADVRRLESRTTLSLVLVAGRRLRWAALGDSPVLVVDGDRGRELTTASPYFVGWPMGPAQVDCILQRGRLRLTDDAWVVVASDGLANFTLTGSTAGAAARVLAQATDAADGARSLIDHAFAAGAGDNVATAVLAPPSLNGAGSGPRAIASTA